MPAATRTICATPRYGVCSSYGRLRPHRTRPPWASTSVATSSANRDLPIPAGPRTVTRCGLEPFTARSHTVRTISTSRSRPTSGVRDVGRLAGDTSGSPTSHAATASRLPFASIGGSSSNENA